LLFLLNMYQHDGKLQRQNHQRRWFRYIQQPHRRHRLCWPFPRRRLSQSFRHRQCRRRLVRHMRLHRRLRELQKTR
jgi:hypothetical protein